MKRIIIAMMLILALVLGVIALAETAEPEITTEQSEQTAPEETKPEDETTPEEDVPDTAPTLEDAFKALHDARLSTKLDELQSELDGYVAAGKLTQEQADMIMNSFEERQETKQNNGRCDCQQMPNCQMPQMPGNQNGGNQMPGNRQFNQCPGNQQGGNQMPQMPGNTQFGQFPGRR